MLLLTSCVVDDRVIQQRFLGQGHFLGVLFFVLCIVRGGAGALWWEELGRVGVAQVSFHTCSGSAAFGFTERSRNFWEKHFQTKKSKKKKDK